MANLTLYMARYADDMAASDDFEALKDARDEGLELVGAIVVDRSTEGDVDVREMGGGEVGGGAALGAAGGLVVGLFAPPLLLSTAIGTGIGALIGELVKRHEEKQLGIDLEEHLPPGSSAIVAIVDDVYLDGVDKAITRSASKLTKAIDSGDYENVKKAVEQAAASIDDAIES